MTSLSYFALLLLSIVGSASSSSSSFDYEDAFYKSLLFLEAQRSGKLDLSQNHVPWRGDSALEDGLSQGVMFHLVFPKPHE